MEAIKTLFRKEEDVASIEYGLIAALIALVIIELLYWSMQI